MWLRVALVAVASLSATGVLAAGTGTGPYRAPEPAAARETGTLRLPSVSHCIRRAVRIGVVPPPGGFASLSVRVAGEEVLQLASLNGPGSVKMVLPYGRSRVRASAIGADGRFAQARRRYRRCTPADGRAPAKPRPKAPPADPPSPVQGGGEG